MTITFTYTSTCGHFAINNNGYVYRLSADQPRRIGEITDEGYYECYLMPKKGRGNRDYPVFSPADLMSLSTLIRHWRVYQDAGEPLCPVCHQIGYSDPDECLFCANEKRLDQ